MRAVYPIYLTKTDDIILVDDCSKDNTLQIL